MQLEISIEALLKKEKVESNRIEFKEGWNPDDIYRSICAFANDFDSQGGGYILIGVEEKDGVAVRPVIGVPENILDKIQKDMVGFDKKIIPAYSPRTYIEEVDGKKIIAIWVATGIERPYKVPDNVTSKNDKAYKVRIRYNSNSVVATPEQEKELYAMASSEPFDMVGNPRAGMEDISEVLLTEHLKATGSRLVKDVMIRGTEEVLDEMQLLSGPKEMHRIRNVALMMFCDHPDKFFPYTEVDIVRFPEGSIKNPKSFIEIPPIKGTVPQIINRTVEKIADMVIENRIDKISGQVESVTTTSYPVIAIKEAVVNAFYHRDYMKHEPVTIEIEPECIRIINCPGLDRSISDMAIREGKRFRSRNYRNRRLGEFLHELELCEGHCTGIPTIQEELEKNGSPAAIFETDADRQSVCVTIPIHPRFLEKDDLEPKKVPKKSAEKKVPKKSAEKKAAKTMEHRERILSFMKGGVWYKASEINDVIDVGSRRLRIILNDMILDEIIEDDGQTKGKRYRIKDNSLISNE